MSSAEERTNLEGDEYLYIFQKWIITQARNTFFESTITTTTKILDECSPRSNGLDALNMFVGGGDSQQIAGMHCLICMSSE